MFSYNGINESACGLHASLVSTAISFTEATRSLNTWNSALASVERSKHANNNRKLLDN